MLEAIKSLFTGLICGLVFALLKLPIPAPIVFNGIIGIIGIYLGYVIIKAIIK